MSEWVAEPLESVVTLETMVRIRAFENKLGALFKKGQLPGFVHLSVGQEATAVGTCSELRADDRISTNHRGHGHMIAKGADMRRMMAEILGRVDGYCKGMGGSMHLMDLELGIIGANGIVAAGIGLATGAGVADQMLGRDTVNVVFFGDGASNSGIFFESMNLAAIWKLPVIFICENNQYTEWMRTEDITAGQIHQRAGSMDIPNSQIDGNDVVVVREAVAQAVSRARAGEGPSLIEMKTYRWFGHNEGEEAFSGKYRPADEIAHWKSLDPIPRYAERLIEAGLVTEADVEAIKQRAAQEADDAVEFAMASPFPPESQALEFLYTPKAETNA